MYKMIYVDVEGAKPEGEVLFTEKIIKHHLLGVLFGKDIKNLVDMLSMTKSPQESEDLEKDFQIIDDILVEFKDILKLQL